MEMGLLVSNPGWKGEWFSTTKRGLCRGRTRGTGRATAAALAKAGAHGLVHGRFARESASLVSEIETKGGLAKCNLGGSGNFERRCAASQTAAPYRRGSIGCACAQRL